MQDSGLKFFCSNCEHSPGAGEAALDPVLIHKHRARASPRESWLVPRSLLPCFFVIKRHRNGKHLVVHADEKMSAFLELERSISIYILTGAFRTK
jgi:hypothetical protein